MMRICRGGERMATTHIRPGPESENWQTVVPERGLTALVILESLGIFFLGPLTETHRWLTGLDAVLVSLTLFATVLVVWRNRIAVITALVAFALGFATAVLRHQLPSSLAMYVDFAAKLVFLGTSTWIVGIAVFGPGQVTLHRIRGAVAIYLQVSLIFMYFYLLLLRTDPQAFAPTISLTGPTGDVLWGARGGGSMAYFSLATLTTLGYGDIVPVHPLARSLATLEALLGQLFPATILARLVTLEVANRRQERIPD